MRDGMKPHIYHKKHILLHLVLLHSIDNTYSPDQNKKLHPKDLSHLA